MTYLVNKILNNGTPLTDQVTTIDITDGITVVNDGSGKITLNADVQNTFLNINTDSGSTTADVPNDTLTLTGGTGISTSITGDTLTITNDDPRIAIVTEEDNVSIVSDTTTYNFTGDVSVTDDGGGQATVNIGGGPTVSGHIFNITGQVAGNVSGAWLEWRANVPLNISPYVMPFNSNLIGVTFSNTTVNADVDIEFWRSAEGVNFNNASLVRTIQVRGGRTYRQTNFTSPTQFSIGDKIGVYLRDQGINSNDPVVILYFQAIDDIRGTATSTESNNMVA